MAHPHRQVLNSFIAQIVADVNIRILELIRSGEIDRMSSHAIKNYFLSAIRVSNTEDEEINNDLFVDYFKKFVESKKGRTKEIYAATLNKIRSYIGENPI